MSRLITMSCIYFASVVSITLMMTRFQSIKYFIYWIKKLYGMYITWLSIVYHWEMLAKSLIIDPWDAIEPSAILHTRTILGVTRTTLMRNVNNGHILYIVYTYLEHVSLFSLSICVCVCVSLSLSLSQIF